MKNEPFNEIWKALADPTRRALLDLLREQPRTTGELCEYFQNLTRFGVMKHLGILENAGLIIIKRKGKFRWNHLNAAPIQSIYERWVKPYEAHWAGQALALKKFIETEGDRQMTDVHSIQIEVEVSINASKERVWDGLVNNIGGWWLKDFYAIPNSKIVLEPRVGGRLYEQNKEGAEGLWYMVTSVYPNQSMEFTGHLRPEYGGPATSLLKLSLSEENGTTKLRISDALFGDVDEKTKGNIEDGWRQLFGDGLKVFVEAGNN